MRDRQSQNIQTARTYTIIGSIVTAVIGLILVIIGAISNFILYLVVGFLALFLALTSYMTTSEKIRTGDPEGSKTPCLLFGILLLIFGGVIGGIFFLLAHVKLTELASPPCQEGRREVLEYCSDGKTIKKERVCTDGQWHLREYQCPKKDKKTIEEPDFSPPVGHLECTSVSHQDRGRSLPIDKLEMTIGRGYERKMKKEISETNYLQLSDDDAFVSRDQGEIKVDPDTKIVSIRHVADTSKTIVNGGILVPDEWKQLKNNNKIEFGTKGSKWRFVTTTRRRETE